MIITGGIRIGDGAIQIQEITPTFDYFIVGAGGGGGGNTGGGGGAGGVVTGVAGFSSGITYTITIGAGGTGGSAAAPPAQRGSVGTTSTLSSTGFLKSGLGGGGGAGWDETAFVNQSGGSGGGGSGPATFGSGLQPASIHGGFGNSGGSSAASGGGGGGGAATVGGNSITPGNGTSGVGGTGTATNIISTSLAVTLSVGQVATSTNVAIFSGSNYLQVQSTTAGDFGTGDFTVEFWMNATAAGTFVAVVGTQSIAGNTTAGMWRISNRINSVNGIYFNYTTGSAFGDLTFSTTNYNDSTWHHIVACRASGMLRMFVDGVQVGSAQALSQSLTSGQKINVGYNAQDNQYYNGYVSNLRVVNGVAIYTGNFTRPTSPLTATQSANPFGGSNTSAITVGSTRLLALQDSITIDNSTYANTITNVSSVTLSAAQIVPFGTSNLFFAGGGSGGAGAQNRGAPGQTSAAAGAAGLGGGGLGTAGNQVTGGTGTARTGGGGGGGGWIFGTYGGAGGQGGSGVVVIRYSNSYNMANTTGGVTFSNDTAYKYHIFTASGTIIF